jgi:hypothetical protein
LHKIKHLFSLGAKFGVKNGNRTRFWFDWCVGDAPVKDSFPQLFVIASEPNTSVAQMLQRDGLGVRFRRSLDNKGLTQWRRLQTLMNEVELQDGSDSVRWHLSSDGSFSVKSMYSLLAHGATVAHHRDMWRVAVPLKIKIFSWQLALDKLPSSMQIVVRNGPSDRTYALCGTQEDASHIFFRCSLAGFDWGVLRQLLGCDWRTSNFPQFHHTLSSLPGSPRRLLWILFLVQSWALGQIRNKLTIEKKVIAHLADVIFKTMIFLQLWSINSKTRDKAGLCWMINEPRDIYSTMRSSP